MVVVLNRHHAIQFYVFSRVESSKFHEKIEIFRDEYMYPHAKCIYNALTFNNIEYYTDKLVK